MSFTENKDNKGLSISASGASLQASLQLLESPATEPRITHFGRWTVREYSVVASTNLVAAGLGEWNAVRADRQTAGRGRFQRSWSSGPGGIWLSAVVPMPATPGRRPLLPLAAGLAVCRVLRRIGVRELRLRWPNDVLVGPKKLAGLLVDQVLPGFAILGIGLNVHNDPAVEDPSLAAKAVRLAELVPDVPAAEELARSVLGALESVCLQLDQSVGEALLREINHLWLAPRRVRVDLDHEAFTARFEGVDAAGRLQLSLGEGDVRVYEAHQVRLLRDIGDA